MNFGEPWLIRAGQSQSKQEFMNIERIHTRLSPVEMRLVPVLCHCTSATQLVGVLKNGLIPGERYNHFRRMLREHQHTPIPREAHVRSSFSSRRSTRVCCASYTEHHAGRSSHQTMYHHSASSLRASDQEQKHYELDQQTPSSAPMTLTSLFSIVFTRPFRTTERQRPSTHWHPFPKICSHVSEHRRRTHISD